MEKSSEFLEELYCPICGDIFEDPLMLYCMHSFCRDCLQERIKKGHVTKKSSCLLFDCPVCRKTVTLDEQGLDGLPKNRLLNKMVDTYRGHHDKQDTPDDRGLGFCTEHTNRELGAFCNGCHVIVCIDCVVGKHKTHDIESVNDVFVKKRKRLQGRTVDIEEDLKKLRKNELEETQYMEQIKTQCKEKGAAIRGQFEEYIVLLEQCRDGLLSELSTRHHQEISKVQQTLHLIHTKQHKLEETLAILKQRLNLDMAALLKEPKPEGSEIARTRKGHGHPQKEAEVCLKSPRTDCFSDCSLSLDSAGLETIINSAQLIWEQEEVDEYTCSPKHMGEKFTLLFEKEWKATFSESTARNKDEIVTQLLSLLMEAYQQAETNCESHLDSLTFHMLQPDIDAHLTNCNILGINKAEQENGDTAVFCSVKESLRKLRAVNTPTLVQDTVFMVHQDTEQLPASPSNSYQRQLTIYTNKCLETCFMFLLQDPPLYIDTDMDRDMAAETDKDNYKFIKRKGRKSKIVAWPPLYLYKGGPVIAKGIIFMPTTA